MPAAMQKEVAAHLHESMLAVMPLFHNLPDSETPVVKQLLDAFKPLAVQPFETVCECDLVTSSSFRQTKLQIRCVCH